MKIIIPGTPIAKKRHKCACVGRKAIAYDPQVKSEMQEVKSFMLKEWNKAFDSEKKEKVLEASNLAQAASFVVSYTFLFPTTQSLTTSQKNAKLWGLFPNITKPDLDNLEKFYADCATGVLWSDDAQVTVASSRKGYSENPRTEIDVMVNESIKLNEKEKNVFTTFGPQKLKEFLKDVRAFWTWPQERVDELLSEGKTRDKESLFSAAASVLIAFADKYGDELKKVKKWKAS